MFKKIKEKAAIVSSELSSTATKITDIINESGKTVKIILSIGVALYALSTIANVTNIFYKKAPKVYIFMSHYEK